MANKKTNIIFISWQPYCSRSDNIARELGGKSYKIYQEWLGSHYCTIAFKYFLQMLETFYILIRKRPQALLVMAPPVFACIPIFLYAKLRKIPYLIDAHTGALYDKMWQSVMFLQKFFARHAATTIVTNEVLAQNIGEWQAHATIIPDVPIVCEQIVKPKLQGNIHVTFVSSFAEDEPLLNVLQATKQLPHVSFYITGKINNKGKKYCSVPGSNVQFTNFLKNSEYYGLLSASDLMLVLTTSDNTMQRGAYEAIYMGKPVVTSHWGILQKSFPMGAIFVDNSITGIVQGIEKAIANKKQLSKEAQVLKQQKIQQWNSRMANLQQIISNSR